ncbi:GNAT family N-acetyltransferase [Comamonas serinivorans]|uniref:GNAT family N-acetyltransferase n=1 Tax=Comamonas serinivorans TaxID=1082851 RepID=UPI0012FA874C|nr:GNAT family N-acetyltransferase [Comamonas serinivorans]
MIATPTPAAARPAAAPRPQGAAQTGLGRLFELVAIRPLSERHRPQILAHLMRLSARDRYLRFGYQATDEQMTRYVNGLNFDRDELHGIFNRRLELVAVSHLALPLPGEAQAVLGLPGEAHGRCAEFGVSVQTELRGQRLGSRLYEHAVRSARVHGLDQLFIHALTENAAMLRIARRHGAKVERMGSEAEAYLSLPPADMNTRVQHLVEAQLAHLDYGMKANHQQWRDLLAIVQETRVELRANRHRSAA